MYMALFSLMKKTYTLICTQGHTALICYLWFHVIVNMRCVPCPSWTVSSITNNFAFCELHIALLHPKIARDVYPTTCKND